MNALVWITFLPNFQKRNAFRKLMLQRVIGKSLGMENSKLHSVLWLPITLSFELSYIWVG